MVKCPETLKTSEVSQCIFQHPALINAGERESSTWVNFRLRKRNKVGKVGEEGAREGRQMERGDEGGRDREKEDLCLISGPGELLGRAREETGMFFNWPRSEERGGGERRGGRTGLCVCLCLSVSKRECVCWGCACAYLYIVCVLGECAHV